MKHLASFLTPSVLTQNTRSFSKLERKSTTEGIASTEWTLNKKVKNPENVCPKLMKVLSCDDKEDIAFVSTR